MREALLVALVLAAGCRGAGPAPETGEPDEPHANATEAGYPVSHGEGEHVDPAAHEAASNLSVIERIVPNDTSRDLPADSAPVVIDRGGDLVVASLASPAGQDLTAPIGASIVDVSDSSQPEPVTTIRASSSGVEPIGITEDGRWLFLGGEFGGSPGAYVYDLSDPANPDEIGRFVDPEDPGPLITHTAWPTDGLVDGRHVTVSGSLCDEEPDRPCYVRVLDTTDPSNPEQIGRWTLPDEVHGSEYTSEVLHLHGGRLALPWAHGGLWTVNLSDPTDPRTSGYHLLAAEPLTQGTNFPVPHTRGAYVLDEGPIVAAGRSTGLWFLQPESLAPRGSAE